MFVLKRASGKLIRHWARSRSAASNACQNLWSCALPRIKFQAQHLCRSPDFFPFQLLSWIGRIRENSYTSNVFGTVSFSSSSLFPFSSSLSTAKREVNWLSIHRGRFSRSCSSNGSRRGDVPTRLERLLQAAGRRDRTCHSERADAVALPSERGRAAHQPTARGSGKPTSSSCHSVRALKRQHTSDKKVTRNSN
jgi:hypothetical protein